MVTFIIPENCIRNIFDRKMLKGDTMKKGYQVVVYRSLSDELAVKA
jgi:hypothetical protein